MNALEYKKVYKIIIEVYEKNQIFIFLFDILYEI